MNEVAKQVNLQAVLPPNGTALFLDLDGTLAEFAIEPSVVRLEPSLLKLIGILHQALGGALAVVSGRRLADLDRLLQPLRLPLAGLHGRERRDAGGRLHSVPADPGLDAVRPLVAAFAAGHQGVSLEDKGSSLALHYRRAPALADSVRAFVDSLLAEAAPALHVLEGKMVVEVIGGEASKGRAIEAFMAEAPFRGRRPVFLGDDVTDEDGFRAVNAVGGLSIKVGEGPTSARRRLADVAAATDWLRRFARGAVSPAAESGS